MLEAIYFPCNSERHKKNSDWVCREVLGSSSWRWKFCVSAVLGALFVCSASSNSYIKYWNTWKRAGAQAVWQTGKGVKGVFHWCILVRLTCEKSTELFSPVKWWMLLSTSILLCCFKYWKSLVLFFNYLKISVIWTWESDVGVLMT